VIVRFYEDPVCPEAGEIVVQVGPHLVHIWREEPARLDQAPYFCPALYVRSTDEGKPNAENYDLCIRRDWSDMEIDPDYGAEAPRALLAKMLCCSAEVRKQR